MPDRCDGSDDALAKWLDAKVAGGMTYRQIHEDLEGKAIRLLLARYDGKPTVLARELQMNRVTLRRRING